MRHRADAADARHQAGHFRERPALAHLLEAAELDHVELRPLHRAGVVYVDGHLGVPLDPCDRTDDDSLGHGLPKLSLLARRLLAVQQVHEELIYLAGRGRASL